MTDLISREAALAAVHEADSLELVQHGASVISERISILPAAQVICTWPSCSHTAKGQCQPLSPNPVDASQTPDPVLSDPRVKALVEALTRLDVFRKTQMRTADYHPEDCGCWRCTEDAVFAALRAIGGEA